MVAPTCLETFVRSPYEEYSKYRQTVVGAALFCHEVIFKSLYHTGM